MMINIESLYKELIISWRDAFQRLSNEERAAVSNLENLSAPCQLEAILLQHRQLRITQQLWMISHFRDLPDLSINIHGPIRSSDAAKVLPCITRSKTFDMQLPEKTRFLGAVTYRDLMESHILRLVESLRESVVHKVWSGQLPLEGIRSKHLLSEDASVWEFIGELDEQGIEQIVSRMVDHAKNSARKTKEPIQSAKRKEIRVKGTYIYPHVWIGSRPSHSFEDDLRERMYGKPRYHIGVRETVLFDNIGRFHVLVTKDGLLALAVDENQAALRILNCFMSLLTLRGTPSLAVREDELAEVVVDAKTGKMVGSQATIKLPRMQPFDYTFVRPRWEEERMPVLDEGLVKQIWREIDEMFDSEVSVDLLQLFGEVYTHFQRAEYPQTILLAWTLVEKWYLPMRERAILIGKSKRMPRRPRMADIADLLDEELIDMEMAVSVYSLWCLRNQVLHEFRDVDRENAQKALEISIAIVGRQTNHTSAEMPNTSGPQNSKFKVNDGSKYQIIN